MSTVIAIVGPTGVGKSELAQHLAASLGVGVLSADSMQVYRGMDIGTAKLPESKQIVPHFGIDLVDPSRPYSAAQYQSYARDIIENQPSQQGRPPVVSGGTGLYLRAALDDFNFASKPKSLDNARSDYEDLAASIGARALHQLLERRDPQSALVIHPNNVRRVVRALDIYDAGGSYADIKAGFKQHKSYYPTLWIALDRDRTRLYDHINARVDQMMLAGLLDEVETLLKAGYRNALTAHAAIGYKELVPVLEDGQNLEDAVADIKQATRRYAKRQLSWFRSDQRVNWINIDNMTLDEQMQRAFDLLDSEKIEG